MVLPGISALSPEELKEFHFGMLIAGVLIHVTTSVIMGLMYGVLLPTLPDIPQSMAWAALLAPILWTVSSYVLLSLANLKLPEGAWPWFILSQFVCGLAMAVAVVGQPAQHLPIVSGIL